MKTIKYLLWLIILALLGILIYQNLDYFMTSVSLKLDLKVASWNWTIPELQNIAYFGICFLLGLLLVGFKGLFTKLGLKKEIKNKNATIASLQKQVNDLKTDLEVFQHDPYIKKELNEEPIVEQPLQEEPEDDTKEDEKPGTAE